MKLKQYYEHTCACGCDGKIEIKKYHGYDGVPKYISGHNKSNFKHGGKGTRLYNIWVDIKQRILNSKDTAYKDYGGRGITICPEWTESYIVFRDWSLNNGYADNLEIDRENNNGNYEPNNCRWVIHKENCNNRRGYKIKSMQEADEIRSLHATGNYTQKELAEKYDVSPQNISLIVNNKSWVGINIL